MPVDLLQFSFSLLDPPVFTAIATTLQCLIADEEMHDGNGEYGEEDLKRFVDRNATEDDEYNG